ncbi:MAG TPA: glycosyltransferase family A protein [Candidatus Omnitrophota bacterium]|nr:glycosyltransferase family A protein [Candidatus Omnitrophota bacterium]HRZ14506.1 glycosyltransferase family A protein [Candidatus Omnitrophota bacterium]
MPKVSVVIPVFNRAQLIGNSARSVLAQSFTDLELIIVDDGSTDGTAAALEALQRTDARIRLVRHERNRGEAAARNTGIRAACGEFIAHHDSDDIWLPQKLERQVRFLESAPAETGLVYCSFRIHRGATVLDYPPEQVKQRQGRLHEVLIKGNFIGTPTVLMRRECFDKAGLFDEALPHLVDWDLWLRVSREYSFGFVAEPLVEVYYQPQSVTADMRARLRATEMVIRKYPADFSRQGRQGRTENILADTYRGMARKAREHGYPFLALRYMWRWLSAAL